MDGWKGRRKEISSSFYFFVVVTQLLPPSLPLAHYSGSHRNDQGVNGRFERGAILRKSR